MQSKQQRASNNTSFNINKHMKPKKSTSDLDRSCDIRKRWALISQLQIQRFGNFGLRGHSVAHKHIIHIRTEDVECQVHGVLGCESNAAAGGLGKHPVLRVAEGCFVQDEENVACKKKNK